MLEIIFLIVLGGIFILFATIQDLKMREVANWVSFSLIIFALGFRFFWSLFSEGGFSFFYQGLIGFGIFFILGNLFYYGRIFAGGDAKLMIAMGTILPFSNNFLVNFNYFILFLVLFLFLGALYGILWSFLLVFKNKSGFKKEFFKEIRMNKKFFMGVMFLGLILMLLGFFESLFFFLGIFIFILPYFYVFAKAVDNSCMVFEISSGKLREGDWLSEDLKVGKRVISKNWEGLTKDQIKQISKKFKKVKIKQGIPFIPVFLISFLVLVFLWFRGITGFF